MPLAVSSHGGMGVLEELSLLLSTLPLNANLSVPFLDPSSV